MCWNLLWGMTAAARSRKPRAHFRRGAIYWTPQGPGLLRSLLLDISSLSSRPHNVRMISSSYHAKSRPECFRQDSNGPDRNFYNNLLRLQLRGKNVQAVISMPQKYFMLRWKILRVPVDHNFTLSMFFILKKISIIFLLYCDFYYILVIMLSAAQLHVTSHSTTDDLRCSIYYICL